MKITKKDLENLENLSSINEGKKDVPIIFHQGNDSVNVFSTTDGKVPRSVASAKITSVIDDETFAIRDLKSFIDVLKTLDIENTQISVSGNGLFITDQTTTMENFPISPTDIIFADLNLPEDYNKKLLATSKEGVSKIDLENSFGIYFNLNEIKEFCKTINAIYKKEKPIQICIEIRENFLILSTEQHKKIKLAGSEKPIPLKRKCSFTKIENNSEVPVGSKYYFALSSLMAMLNIEKMCLFFVDKRAEKDGTIVTSLNVSEDDREAKDAKDLKNVSYVFIGHK